MTDDQKKELLKNKFLEILQAGQKDEEAANTLFNRFFNLIKNNDEAFVELAKDEKAKRQTSLDSLQSAITDHESKIAELEAVIEVVK